jgi:hypothetical protein
MSASSATKIRTIIENLTRAALHFEQNFSKVRSLDRFFSNRESSNDLDQLLSDWERWLGAIWELTEPFGEKVETSESQVNKFFLVFCLEPKFRYFIQIPF